MYLSTEKCKKVVLWVLLFFIFLFLTKKLSIILFPLLASFFLAFSLQKPITSLQRSLKIPRKVSAFVLVLLLVLLFVFVSFFIIKKMQSELISFSDVFIKIRFKEYFLSDYLSLIIEKALSLFSSVGEIVPKLLIFITVFIFSSFYISAECDKIEKSFDTVKKFKKAFTRILSGYVKSYFILFLFTFAFLYFSFSVFKFNFAFVGALIIAVLDIFPILSAGVLIVPYAIFEFLSGYTLMSFILILIAICVTVIKKIIEPKILSGFVGLHPLISLIAISSGYLFMGFSGAFLFPFILSIIIELKKEM